jgi:protein-tyrosine phosphatase
MWTELHWVEGPWAGRLALAPRPRGGDWLPDELAHWKAAGVNGVLSLLEPAEARELELQEESVEAAKAGLEYWSLPMPDRGVPRLEADFVRTLASVEMALGSGNNVIVHCRQGVGRTGLVAVGMLVTKGHSPEAAIALVSAARGVPVPETEGQKAWIASFAAKRAKPLASRKRSRRAA